MTFTVIICTHNRCNILHHCLESFVTFGKLTQKYEIVIVDNASTDSTLNTVKSFQDKIPYLRYVIESKIGLSHARNRGALEAKGEWLFYLDDDAKLRESTLSEFCKVIDNYPFVLFTGIYKPWYINEPPKWLKGNLVSYILKGEKGIRPINEDYISGGIMGIKKSVLLNLGMFDSELGMKGDRVGYGEESDLQFKACQKNLPIGINTDMIMDHLVGLHKYNYKWFLTSSGIKSADAFRINPLNKKFQWWNIIISMLERSLKNFIRSTLHLFFKKDYFLVNWYIDNMAPMNGYFGIIKAKLKYSANQNNRD